MLFDTHTHVNFAAFKDEQDEVINRSLAENTWMINVGTQSKTSEEAAKLTQKFEKGVYAAVGLHPIHTYQQVVDEEESHFQTRAEKFDEKLYTGLLNEKVIAIGECGLDYFRMSVSDQEAAKKIQKEEFAKQLAFAKSKKLPVVIHCRDAYEDLLDILKSEYQGEPAVMHSFTDTWETAKKFLDLGCYVALNGILVFDKTGKLAEVCKKVPNDRILTETDAPYLTPPPFRGKRNEPSYVQYVVLKIAEIKGINLSQAAELTFNNALKLFNVRP